MKGLIVVMNKNFIEKYPFDIDGVYFSKDWDDDFEYEEDEEDDQDNWMSL